MTKMNYEFMEVMGSWMLMLNDLPCRSFPKKTYTRIEAETLASLEVGRAVKRYGAHVVNYNGLYVTKQFK